MGPEIMFMGLVIVVIFFIALYAITLSSIDERTRESEIHAEHVSKQLEDIREQLQVIERRLRDPSEVAMDEYVEATKERNDKMMGAISSHLNLLHALDVLDDASKDKSD